MALLWKVLHMNQHPLVPFDHYSDDYPAVTVSAYDAESVWQAFRQKAAELPKEMPLVSAKDPKDYAGSMKRQIYVSKTGNDANAGTIEAPFASLEKALETIADQGGGVIWIRGGTYTISQTIELTAAHGGTPESPTFIAAYPGESVNFTTACAVDSNALRSIDEAIAEGLISASVKDRLNTFTPNNHQHVYVTKLAENIPVDARARAVLYVNDRPFHVARYPDAGAFDEALNIKDGRIPFSDWASETNNVRRVGKATSAASILHKEHKDDPEGWELYYDNAPYASRIDRYDLSDTQLYTYAAVFEEWERVHFALTLCKDPDNGRTYLKSPTSGYYGTKECRSNNMYFYNIIEELDAEHEYYVDQVNRLLYVWSKTPLVGATILYCANTQRLLSATEASNVIVDGIHFTKTNASALIAEGCDALIVQNCKFSDITSSNRGDVVIMKSARRSGFLRCEMYHLSTYVSLFGSLEQLKPTHNFVQNCYFHDPYESSDTAIYVGGISDVTSHNLFKHYKMGLLGAYECIVEYNEFDGGSQKTRDSGPIYLSMPNHKCNNHIRYNLLHHLNYSLYGIYLDDVSGDNYVYGNIIEYAKENSGGKCVNIHSGNRNVVYNNIGLRAGLAGMLDAPNYAMKTLDGEPTGVGGLSHSWPAMVNVAESSFHYLLEHWGREAIQARYPLLYQYDMAMVQHSADCKANPDWSPNSDKVTGVDDLEISLRKPTANVYINNVMIDCGADKMKAEGISALGKESAKMENNLAYTSETDLRFMDEASGNYTFKPDSPVYQIIPDFEPIPFHRMGRI